MRWDMNKKGITYLLLSLFSLAVLAVVFLYKIPDIGRSAFTLPLSGVVIAIDPGHGGPDGGAVSKNGLVEKDVTLPISFYLRDFLQEAGALVIMTREADTDLASENTKGLSRRKTEDLHNRARIIKDKAADLLISIHLNSFPSQRWYGAQTFYHPGRKENGILAYLIQDEIRRTLQNTTRKAKRKSDVFLLKSSEIPAVLVEVGFLSNPREANLLSKEQYQKKVALSIYQGILRYYSGETPPEGQNLD
ncbi:N-acetylmuramoyl-L-alanine amidase CwlD [Microaerobacter geothermalis]|uniref:N-acetylmuramoyl-L-alanine amidase CwlD n=1 Tax=Microaerobacter geothermalis TaxID=674972 RepID=UPI001F3BFEE0|nr:N-acetylmuramoyl-L-alanine amidase CwlD [Microaerobacter geothermalis]MCF6095281.1 N-acetylmuramoyl-L-alanine amidase CwlD [Microaerobacter geothermalis]